VLNIHKITETDSTNLYLRKLLNNSDLPDGFCVSADFQTNGRGQKDSVWEAKKGENLLFSFLLNSEKIPPTQQFLLSEIVSTGMCNALKNIGLQAEIKWANDIFFQNKKLAGILIETIILGEKMKYAIVGIGLNVNQTDFSENLPYAVSLHQILGYKLDCQMLLENILTEILKIFKDFDKKNSDDLQKKYFELLYRNSGFHFFEEKNNKFRAKILSVAPDGCLKLLTDNNIERSFYFKEIKFVL
jgi:BirA family biotin operon repressor/biotin-[acetyl-CoA-carboxylase] ligase